MGLTPIKITDVVYSDAKPLTSLIKSGAIEDVAAMLMYLISDVVLSFNVGKNMNAAQIKNTVSLLIGIEEFHHLKPQDYKMCFDRAKTGKYGKTYDTLDSRVIFEWLRKYDGEREDEIIAHNRSKSIPPPVPVIKEATGDRIPIGKLLTDFADVFSTKKKAISSEKQRPISQNDRLIKSWISKFNQLFGGRSVGGIKCIEQSGQTMTIDDYLNYRLEKYNKRMGY